MAPPVCKYFLKGECKFGERCKFDHPRGPQRNDNRFATFQTPENSPRDSHGRGNNDGRPSSVQNPAFSLNKDIIIADLSTERPQWILSAYGPGSKAPAQLFGGPVREQSFEEMRLHHYKGVASGNPELAIQQANALAQEAESQMLNALSNVDGAMDFIRRADNEHPNRNDICQASAGVPGSVGTNSNNSFEVGSAPPSQPAPGFGQPSVLGTKPNPFSAPKQAFGQPSTVGSTGVFGKPSVLGQGPNPFGTSSREASLGHQAGDTARPFSTFTATSNSFGTASQPGAPYPFGQISSTKEGPFSHHASQADNPFTQSGARPNPFGQPSGQSQPSAFAFAATSSSFGASPQLAQKDPFGMIQLGLNQALPSNPFSPQNSTAHMLASSAQQSSSSSNAGPFALPPHAPRPTKSNGAPSLGPNAPNAQYQHPPLLSYASRDENHKLRTFKGKPVVYRENEAGIQNRDGTWEKIWFPDGAPSYYGATELSHETYTEDIKKAYLQARETGCFKDGVMPYLPPKREWCLWDF